MAELTAEELLRFLPPDLTVAATVWGEARSQGLDGMAAVAWVILNRTKRPDRWAASMKDVCLQPHQFSCWEPAGGRANYFRTLAAARILLGAGANLVDPTLREALWVSHGVIARQVRDLTRGADHYLTVDLYHSNPPAWVAAMVWTATVGDHVFLHEPFTGKVPHA